jgi:uncharacterized membrane protein
MRLLSHLLALPRSHPLDAAALKQVEAAIAESEARHGGQIRVAVEAALDPLEVLRGETARERAVEVFSDLRVWDTERNNGVLLYLLLADRDVEIVADRGLNGIVSAAEWEAVCRAMEASLSAGRYADAIADGIRRIGELVAKGFPAPGSGRNELADAPVPL